VAHRATCFRSRSLGSPLFVLPGPYINYAPIGNILALYRPFTDPTYLLHHFGETYYIAPPADDFRPPRFPVRDERAKMKNFATVDLRFDEY